MNMIDLANLEQLIDKKATFVLNIIASWCPDCTDRQAPLLPEFTRQLQSAELPLYQLLVQQERKVFLSEAHQQVVDNLGGHGYPRTVLFKDGKALDSDNVEVIEAETLSQLAERFMRLSQ